MFITELARLLASVLIIVQAQPAMPVGAFRIMPGDSRVEFVMRDNRGGFTGTTDRVEGTVTVRKGDGDAFDAAVDATIDARTITTGSRQRDGQMRRNVLHTDRFPFIAFRGNVTAGQVAGHGSARMRGALTIKDVTREIDMPVEVTVASDEYRAAGEIILKLSDYGIPIPRFLIFRAEDPVTVRLQVRVHR